jgi:hypothetical protein
MRRLAVFHRPCGPDGVIYDGTAAGNAGFKRSPPNLKMQEAWLARQRPWLALRDAVVSATVRLSSLLYADRQDVASVTHHNDLRAVGVLRIAGDGAVGGGRMVWCQLTDVDAPPHCGPTSADADAALNGTNGALVVAEDGAVGCRCRQAAARIVRGASIEGSANNGTWRCWC